MAENVTINDWTGTGYIVIDPATGAGAYMMSGGIAGGAAGVIATALVALAIVVLIVVFAEMLVVILPSLAYAGTGMVFGGLAVGLAAGDTAILGLLYFLVFLIVGSDAGTLTFPNTWDFSLPEPKAKAEEKTDTDVIPANPPEIKSTMIYRFGTRGNINMTPRITDITGLSVTTRKPTGKYQTSTIYHVNATRVLVCYKDNPESPYHRAIAPVQFWRLAEWAASRETAATNPHEFTIKLQECFSVELY